MGIFSEIHNEKLALSLQKVLIKAINSDNPELLSFCKELVYPIYREACSEIWSIDFNSSKDHLMIELTYNS
jgi:hypothetical protein